MRSIRAAACLIIITMTAAVAIAQGAAGDDLCGRPKTTPGALYDKLAKDSGLKEMRRSDIYVALENGSNGTLWTFTLPAHPAHPAVVCRRVMERRGILDIPTTIQCEGAKAACAKLKSDFDALNERMILELYKQQRK